MRTQGPVAFIGLPTEAFGTVTLARQVMQSSSFFSKMSWWHFSHIHHHVLLGDISADMVKVNVVFGLKPRQIVDAKHLFFSICMTVPSSANKNFCQMRVFLLLSTAFSLGSWPGAFSFDSNNFHSSNPALSLGYSMGGILTNYKKWSSTIE